MSKSNTELEVILYEKNNKKLLITLILVNLILFLLVFSGAIQFILMSLINISIFDYYSTYALLLMFFNILSFTLYHQKYEELFLLRKKLEAEKRQLDLNQKIYGEFLNKKTLGELFCYNTNLFCDLYNNDELPKIINDLQEGDTKVFLNDMFNDYKNNRHKSVIVIVFFMLFTLFTSLVLSTEGKISVNKFMSQYENKYQKIEYELKEKQDQREMKQEAMYKLERLREQYINEYGSDNDVVKQIEADISKLKSE